MCIHNINSEKEINYYYDCYCKMFNSENERSSNTRACITNYQEYTDSKKGCFYPNFLITSEGISNEYSFPEDSGSKNYNGQ
jgi:hypothetical protein